MPLGAGRFVVEVNGTGISQTASVSRRRYHSTNSRSHLNLRAARPSRTNGRRLGTLQKQRCLGNREALNREGFSFLQCFKGLKWSTWNYSATPFKETLVVPTLRKDLSTLLSYRGRKGCMGPSNVFIVTPLTIKMMTYNYPMFLCSSTEVSFNFLLQRRRRFVTRTR